MISDLGTAMERDEVFTREQNEKAKMTIRQSDKEYIVPNVLMQGSPQKEIDHEFFLISVRSADSAQLRPAEIEQVLSAQKRRLPGNEPQARHPASRPQEVYGEERQEAAGRAVREFPAAAVPQPRDGH